MRRILLATGNPHKIEKLSWIVSGFFDRVDTLNDQNIELDVDESATTFLRNATQKAESYSKIIKGYAIATDGGVSIPALGENWDSLKTKRFAGDKASDSDRVNSLLTLMAGKVGDDRAMNWREAISIAYNGKSIFSVEVEGVHGLLQEEYDPRKYKPGIWVCSVWYFPEIGKNFFDMSEQEKEYVELSWHKLYRITRSFLSEL